MTEHSSTPSFVVGPCGGLNENSSHRLRCLSTCSPTGGAVYVGLGGEPLLEDACHWGQALEFKSHLPFPVLSLSLPPV